MKAVVLAAGQGTRLRPYTADRPKPLVELDGRSLLAQTSETLRNVGIDDQVVVTGYEADKIEARGYETVRNDAYDETEMVYSLFTAEPAFPEAEDLVVSYGDILYEPRVVRALAACEAPICVVVDRAWRSLWETRFQDPLADAETLRLGSQGQVTEIGQSPTGYDEIEGQYIGLFKLRADIISDVVAVYSRLADDSSAAGTATDLDMTSFLQYLIDHGWRVQAVPIQAGWLEVDTVDDLEMYRSLLEDSRLSEFIQLKPCNKE